MKSFESITRSGQDLESHDRLIYNSDSDTDSRTTDESSSSHRCPRSGHRKALIAHVALALVNLLVSAGILLRMNSPTADCRQAPMVPSPIHTVLSYQLQRLDGDAADKSNPAFIAEDDATGPPSLEADEAWEEMLRYGNIRLTDEDLSEDYRNNPDLVRFTDGSGIFGTTSAFHSIHCIKWTHHLLYSEHYYANRSAEDIRQLKLHGHHCLTYLLRTVKCNADLSVFPMIWGEKDRLPFGIDQGRHQCVDWQRIMDWAKHRSVDVFQPGLVVHPTLGWSYAESVENVTGVGHT